MTEFQKKVIKAMPIEEWFTAQHVANKVYPNLFKRDTEGRDFNRGSPIVARLLNKLRGISKEYHNGTTYYWAHEEFYDGQEKSELLR